MLKCPDCGCVIVPDLPSDGFNYASPRCSPLAEMTSDWITEWWKDRKDTRYDDPHLGLAVYILERLFPLNPKQGGQVSPRSNDCRSD